MANRSQQSISVFFPCYNDSKSIPNLVEKSFRILPQLTKYYEVIVIDDGSTDNSGEVLERLKKRYKNLKAIYHSKNLGYGGALISGFKTANYELIFYTDGDGQYDVSELPILVSLMSPDVSFINGIKMVRHDPNYRIVIGNFYSFLARWLFWLPIHDVDCDFRLMRKKLVDKLDLKSQGGSICIELVKKAQRHGGKFREVSIHHQAREFGSSQFFVPKHLFRTFWELGSFWFTLMVLHKN